MRETIFNLGGCPRDSLIYVIAFVDLFAVGMLRPLMLEHFRHSIGLTPTTAGALLSLYGSVQLLSSPLVGRVADVSSRRQTMLVCILFSAASYWMLGSAATLAAVIVSRFVAGIFKHTQTLGKALIADRFEQGSSAFARFFSAGTSGFIFGPIIGGHLAEYDDGFALICRIVAVLFLFNLFLVWRLPIVEKAESTTSEQQNASARPNDDLSAIGIFRRNFDHFVLHICAALMVLVIRDNFNSYMRDNFGASSSLTGYVSALQAAINCFSSGFVYPFVHGYVDDEDLFSLAVAALITTAVSVMTLAPDLPTFLACLVAFNVGVPMFRVTMTAQLVRRNRGGNQVGVLLGTAVTVTSIARMLSGVATGFAIDYVSSSNGPEVLATALGLACVGQTFFRWQSS